MKKTVSGLYAESDGKPVALTDVTLEADITDTLSRVTLSQKYKNTEDLNIEAVYCFPLEESAALYEFKIISGNTEITGHTEERDRAFDLYDREIEDGNASFLLDMEEKDILVASVGNLLPGQEVEVRISYVSELSVCDGNIRFQLPSTVSPRYITPFASDMIKADRISPPRADEVPYMMSIKVRGNFKNCKNVSSPSHKINVEKNASGFIAALRENKTRMDRDFILEITPDEIEKPRCLISRHENGRTAAFVRLVPDFEIPSDPAPPRSDIIFILDCSGSMANSSIEQARETLELCLRSMNRGDYFNIIRFGSEYKLYSSTPVEYNEDSMRQVLKSLSLIDADMGGTELSEALEHACSMKVVDGCRRDIILLTDGEIHNSSEVINYVAKNHNNARFYTFGIGYGASHHLVKGLARVTGGAWEMIQPGEKIYRKVLRQFSRLIQPRVDKIKIKTNGIRLDFTSELPTMYHGDSFSFFAWADNIRKKPQISISGEAGDLTLEWKTDFHDLGKGNIIPLLAAASNCTSLELEHDSKGDAVNRNKVLELGLDFNLLTKYTSMVAVEKRRSRDKAVLTPKYRRIPILVTKGYGDKRNISITSFTAGENRAFYSEKSAILNAGHIPATKEFEKLDEETIVKILKSQTAEGCFDAVDLLCREFRIEHSELMEEINRISETFEDMDKENIIKLLITSLVMKLIRDNREMRDICARSLDKAEKWICDTLPPQMGYSGFIEDFAQKIISRVTPEN